MGTITLIIAPFFILQKSGIALSHSAEPLILYLRVLWERFCLRLWRNFRISAYGKLHMCVNRWYLLLIQALSDCKINKNIKIIIAVLWKIQLLQCYGRYCHQMNPHLHYFGLGSMYPNVCGFILKNYFSYFHLLFSLSKGHDKSLHVPEFWSCRRKRITLHPCLWQSLFLKSQQVSP